MMNEVIVVGAGLSGLTAAWHLQKAGVKVLVLEARERWGGRIHTVLGEGRQTPLEMGATWFADKHIYLMELIGELNIGIFRQYQKGIGVFESDPAQAPQFFQVPEAEEASYRVMGGSSCLTDALAQALGPERIRLNAPLAKVKAHQHHLEVSTSQGETFACQHLVLTIPPYLLLSQKIAFDPALPQELQQIMENTHTWMGDAIKFAVEYEKPFWRAQGFSGAVFSSMGMVPEVHDHSNAAATHFALKGFLAADAARFSKAQRAAMVVAHLGKMLGKEAANYLSYTEKLWQQEAYTYAAYNRFVMPHQFNGHPCYGRPLMDGRLYLAASETSPYFGGYMDGAVYAGRAAASNILLQRKRP